MSFRGHPLAYPVTVTIGALAISLAWAPFADPELLGLLAAVALIIVGYTVLRLAIAYSTAGTAAVFTRPGEPVRATEAGERDVTVRRVRQQYRLVSRSWLEFVDGERTVWLPVFFDPALVILTPTEAEFSGRAIRIGALRVYPAGRRRDSEPVGRLIDNPSRPDPDGVALATTAARWRRRLLLDAQPAVAAPFAGLFWVYVAGGGPVAFTAATVVAATTATWLTAIRGSDPS
ncbi:hypothetical protein HLB23_30040 [Nocardia uniformis]|uniref:Uncharacterized protein n=1 Tax=Nocardia uniformis TaxID=53432 RepID=A0A849C8A9_9NOCA|nr:hypothetical protein [Nocardia uniformis]NNH74046.1 hypothetical protein [Nocardia uniformis]